MGGRSIRMLRDIVRAVGLGLALGLLTGCASEPDLPPSRLADADRFENASWPQLIAFDETIGADPAALENPGPALLARAQVLRRRAAALRGPIITAQDRERVNAAVARRRAAITN